MSLVTKQTCPAPAGLWTTRQKLTLVAGGAPSFTTRRMPGFSPMTATVPSFTSDGVWAAAGTTRPKREHHGGNRSGHGVLQGRPAANRAIIRQPA